MGTALSQAWSLQFCHTKEKRKNWKQEFWEDTTYAGDEGTKWALKKREGIDALRSAQIVLLYFSASLRFRVLHRKSQRISRFILLTRETCMKFCSWLLACTNDAMAVGPIVGDFSGEIVLPSIWSPPHWTKASSKNLSFALCFLHFEVASVLSSFPA